jgi:hypothetical protein
VRRFIAGFVLSVFLFLFFRLFAFQLRTLALRGAGKKTKGAVVRHIQQEKRKTENKSGDESPHFQ